MDDIILCKTSDWELEKKYQLFYPYLYGKIISKLVNYSKYEITGIYEYLSTTISKVVAKYTQW